MSLPPSIALVTSLFLQLTACTVPLCFGLERRGHSSAPGASGHGNLLCR